MIQKNYYILYLQLGENGSFMYNPALKEIDEKKFAFHMFKEPVIEFSFGAGKKKFNEEMNKLMAEILEREDEFLCVRGKVENGLIRLEIVDLFPPEG